jgi:hypothetical protein
MNKYVQFTLQGGESVQVEYQDGVVRSGASRGADDTTQEAARRLEAALGIITPISNAILAGVKGIDTPAESVTVEFGLKVAGEAKFIIASAGTEANFRITLAWGER